MLAPTLPDQLCDEQGRPYFLWDTDLTLVEFRRLVESPNLDVRAYHVGRLMRQAKPDDVFSFVTVADIRELWPRIERYLGQTKPFWQWLLERWRELGAAGE